MISWRQAKVGERSCRLAMATCLTGVLLLPGCVWLDNYRGAGFTGEDATWGASLRKPEPAGDRYFFNEKSNQIERSLGM